MHPLDTMMSCFSLYRMQFSSTGFKCEQREILSAFCLFCWSLHTRDSLFPLFLSPLPGLLRYAHWRRLSACMCVVLNIALHFNATLKNIHLAWHGIFICIRRREHERRIYFPWSAAKLIFFFACSRALCLRTA